MPQRDPQSKKIAPGDSDYLERLRHSCAHVMAQAVQELFPGTKLGIGPTIENGFYYDFDTQHPFTLEDLPRIEARMREIAHGKHPFIRSEKNKQEAIEYYKRKEEKFKIEIIQEIPEEKVSFYQQNGFTDLCRGPHMTSTEEIRHFKLLSISGAYWRGNEKNPMLQRIYGTAFAAESELKTHLERLGEAKKRDHRKLGKELDLFSIQEKAGPGLIFWHPKGALIRKIIEDWLRDETLRRGYCFAFTPHLAQRQLWETSGHTSFYKDNMFAPIEVDAAHYLLRPMNCPFHILIYQDTLRSYRELPLRLAELGTVYRYERSGVLHGLLRVRGFTQDDAHIFCTPQQIKAEVDGCLDFALQVFQTFGFTQSQVDLSTWDEKNPGKYSGNAQDWERTSEILRSVLEARGIAFRERRGEAAFYGPKIDLQLIDAIGRSWQLSTIQLDFNLPEKFRLEYVSESGLRERPWMIHRALLGSLERFFGILIEHHAGAFPTWLAPVQAKLLTITDAQIPYGKEILKKLQEGGVRTEGDFRGEKIGLKIREATLQKIPYLMIVGKKEQDAKTLTLRARKGEDLGSLTPEQLIQKIKEELPHKGPEPIDRRG
ncbi:MAG: threonine--tRNA ligase [Elusimicrobia bacterium]|nr:threonine--tRNA ligase [Elusimicrobiota bacterium]